MIKIISCFFCLFLLGTTTGYAQSAVVPSGGDATGTGGSFSFTIGQPCYTVSGTSTTITDGVQQPYEVYISVDKIEGISLEMKAYPNPTTSQLYLEIKEVPLNDLQWRLFDATGKLLSQQKIEDSISEVATQSLVSGVYILQVTQDQKNVKSFTIIKN